MLIYKKIILNLRVLNWCFSPSPGVRNGHAMVYYTPSKSIILFGGADDAKVNGDTWSFSNNTWKKITNEGPSPKTFPSMVMADNYILLFGGNAVLFGNDKNPMHYLADTWKFEDGKWTKISVTVHPDARAEAAIAYDLVQKKFFYLVVEEAEKKWIDGDTWEFNGNTWTEVDTTGPTPRSGANMVYDTKLKQIVLFGGNPVIAKEANYNGSMWSWNGNTWNQMKSNDPLILNSCMAYNTIEKYILRFGGWNGEKRINETWIYKENGWKKLPCKNAPAARNHAIMIYDPDNDAFVLYGGHDGDNVFGDMWTFKHNQWKLMYATKPLKRVDNGH